MRGRRRNYFVDWAYGASKFPEILAKTCNDKSITPYPTEAMNGLAFIVSIGAKEEFAM